MAKFEDVDIVKEANVYFDGKVTSRTLYLKNGERKTLGFMLKGEYTFDTKAQETMEVLGGSMKVKLPGETEFVLYEKGDSFIVKENASFELMVETYSDYCCSYAE